MQVEGNSKVIRPSLRTSTSVTPPSGKLRLSMQIEFGVNLDSEDRI